MSDPRPQLAVFVARGDARLRERIATTLEADSMVLSASPMDPVDVAVLVFDLSASSRVRELRAAISRLPGDQVTIVSSDFGPLGVRRAVREGVAGIVPERSLEAALAPAVRAVAAGLTAIPLELRADAEEVSLSRRELEVLRLVAAGKTNQEIAAALFLAESTVKTHMASLFRKVGVDSRKQMVRLAFDPDGGLSHLLAQTVNPVMGDSERVTHVVRNSS